MDMHTYTDACTHSNQGLEAKDHQTCPGIDTLSVATYKTCNSVRQCHQHHGICINSNAGMRFL